MNHISIVSSTAFLATVLLCGCTQYDAHQIGNVCETHVVAYEPAPDSIFANVFELTRIAEQTLGISASSRGSELQISEVPDSVGNPALYIMQCGNDNGFVIASARKSYWPVLAYSDEGNFSRESEMPAPVREWLANMTEQVATSTNESSTNEVNSAWQIYENHFIPGSSSCSSGRSSSNSDEEYWTEITAMSHILDDSIVSWQNQGYEAGLLADIRGITEELRERWITEAQNGVFAPYANEWMYLAAVRMRSGSYTGSTGFELNYKWDQIDPFNQSFPMLSNNRRAFVGCANIAMGMIMRYHQWPATFNWNGMPYDTATKTTSDFLYEIALTNHSTFGPTGTSTYLKNVTRSLKNNYGYHAKDNDFDYDILRRNIQAYKPVICSDVYINENGEKKGHAWVVSGTQTRSTYYTAELWFFTSKRHVSYQDTQSYYNYSSPYYYVNWGWGGGSNGYFVDLYRANPQSPISDLKGMSIEIYPLK